MRRKKVLSISIVFDSWWCEWNCGWLGWKWGWCELWLGKFVWLLLLWCPAMLLKLFMLSGFGEGTVGLPAFGIRVGGAMSGGVVWSKCLLFWFIINGDCGCWLITLFGGIEDGIAGGCWPNIGGWRDRTAAISSWSKLWMYSYMEFPVNSTLKERKKIFLANLKKSQTSKLSPDSILNEPTQFQKCT